MITAAARSYLLWRAPGVDNKTPVWSPEFVLTTYLRIRSIRVATPSHARGDTGR